MNTKFLVYVCVVILLSFSVLCVLCPLVASAETPSDEFPTYSNFFRVGPYDGSILPYLGNVGKQEVVDLIQKAYDCNLFAGQFPFLAGLSDYSVGNYEHCLLVYTLDSIDPGVVGQIKPNLRSVSTSGTSGYIRLSMDSSSSAVLYITVYRLLENGTFNVFNQFLYPQNLSFPASIFPMAYYDGSQDKIVAVPANSPNFSVNVPHGSTADISLGLSQILGAYDRILAGYTVGGDGYDEGYTAGYDDGYEVGLGNGWTQGREVGRAEGYETGYDEGYDDGYETGYDNGWETGYDIGFDHGHDAGHSSGYTEGYDDGYETGYWEGWDEGYDDGYEMGEFYASPITIDIPSVITSVPQSAKSIINNTFGFELFGINVAGLLSVLLIVSIIGFVVKWLMSR